MTKTKERKEKQEVIAWNPPIDWIKQRIEEAGTTIGSVYFNKRKDNVLRKMCYRLHVTEPSIAIKPKGAKTTQVCKKCGLKSGECKSGNYKTVIVGKNRKLIDSNNDQITVLDTNKIVRDKKGKIIGRGAWRCVPLDKVVRISNQGKVYIINRF